MYHFSNICRVFDRKNKKMYTNLNIFKDIKQIDEDIFSIKGDILNKENLTLMLSTGFRDSSGNIIYEKDLIEYNSYNEKELIYVDDVRRVNLADYPSYKLDKLGSIYNKDIRNILNDFYNTANGVEVVINKCPFCKNTHVYYLYDKKLGDTCEVFHLGIIFPKV